MTNREVQQAQLYLSMARNNINRIKELSALSGVSYCCIGKLEQRQAELEYALYGLRRTSRNNLGFALPAIGAGWWIAGGIISAATAVGAYLWHHDDTQAARNAAEADLIRAQNEQALLDKGLKPNEWLPPKTTPPIEEKSAIDKIVDVIQLAVIIGGIGLAFGIFKGFGKK